MPLFPDYHIGPRAMKYFKLGYQCQMRGDLEEAVRHYKRSLEIESSAEGHTFLGWAYSFMGRLDEAIDECRRAIAIDPEFGNPYNDIGAYLLQSGAVDEAIPWLEKARTAPRYENPEYAWCNLGKAYELKGLWPLAREAYQQALEIRGDYLPATAALDRVEVKLN